MDKLYQKLANVILLSYNSSNDLSECLPAMLTQDYDNFDCIVIDNASADGTSQLIRSNFPSARLIETGANLGYPGGNNVAVIYAKGEYLVIANPDTVPDKAWLSELIKPLKENSGIDITTSKILMYSKKGHINTCANHCHFTGLDFCRGLNEPASKYSSPEEVGVISGCAFAIRRDAFLKLDGFDPDFFLYLEDADLSWRARLYGYKIQYVPTSIIYHKYKLSVAPWKEFYLERNRYVMLLKNYSWKMLLLLLPSLIVTEIVTWGHALLQGPRYAWNKAKAYFWLIANIKSVLKKRRVIQSSRKINDKEFLRLLEWRIPFEQMIENRLLYFIVDRFFNTFYKINYRIINYIV
jgi:GT2 family glycosyltransferase